MSAKTDDSVRGEALMLREPAASGETDANGLRLLGGLIESAERKKRDIEISPRLRGLINTLLAMNFTPYKEFVSDLDLCKGVEAFRVEHNSFKLHRLQHLHRALVVSENRASYVRRHPEAKTNFKAGEQMYYELDKLSAAVTRISAQVHFPSDVSGEAVLTSEVKKLIMSNLAEDQGLPYRTVGQLGLDKAEESTKLDQSNARSIEELAKLLESRAKTSWDEKCRGVKKSSALVRTASHCLQELRATCGSHIIKG